jgi:D-glycero-D-manno-heptose 1,7-bisphosphate phosphatase
MNGGIPDVGHFDSELGVWLRIPSAGPGPQRPALFLDRDGVIVEDSGYLSRASQVAVIPGAAEAIALANSRRIPVVEVTNQSGVGRGYYDWDAFAEVECAIARELASGGAHIDAVFACPFHRDGVGIWAQPQHPCRKPRPGMLLAAARLLDLDLRRSWIVGDKLADLVAGERAGLRGGIHVLTGHGAEERTQVTEWQPQAFEVRLVESIGEVAGVFDSLDLGHSRF